MEKNATYQDRITSLSPQLFPVPRPFQKHSQNMIIFLFFQKLIGMDDCRPDSWDKFRNSGHGVCGSVL